METSMEIQSGTPPFPMTAGARKYDFKSMQVGAWLIAESIEDANRMQNAARAYGRYHGIAYRLSRRKHDGIIYLMRIS